MWLNSEEEKKIKKVVESNPEFGPMVEKMRNAVRILEQEIEEEKKLPITQDDIVDLVIDLNVSCHIDEFIALHCGCGSEWSRVEQWKINEYGRKNLAYAKDREP